MPLHKSSRAPRLDPTMISAPLGDFRHTMHIGRGGDAFGDTSFLSSHGPAGPDQNAPGNMPGGVDSQTMADHDGPKAAGDLGCPESNTIQHSESVSSFDLDLDLGPSMLGDILGVMDGLGLDSDWTSTNEEEVFTPNGGAGTAETKPCKIESDEGSMSEQNELNGNKLVDDEPVDGGRITDENGIKPKGLRPKVRFSDKREEIIRQASEEEEGQGFDFQDDDELECGSPTVGEVKRGTHPVSSGGGGEAEVTTNHKAEVPPSPASSSHSSEYEGVTPLDRRRVDSCHSETDSDEEEEEGGDDGRGYTFEDEFDDEIGL